MKRLLFILLLLLSPLTLRAQSGGYVSPSSGGGVGNSTSAASPIMALYFTNQCPVSNTGQCFYTASNTQIANDCTWSNAATLVTCATAHFAASDVGKRLDGYLMNGLPNNIFGCVAGRTSFTSMGTSSLTISSFTSSTQINLSANPANTATSSHGCVIWGTPDDSNASSFEAVYGVISSFCPKVMLAAANYWFDSPHFYTQPTGCAALPGLTGASTTSGNMLYTVGFELEGRGPGPTTIYVSAIFPNGDACTRSEGPASVTGCFLIPVEGKFSDFQITGGGQSTCQLASGKNLLAMAVGTLENVVLTNMCYGGNGSGTIIGVQADSFSQIHQVNNSGWGTTCLQAAQGGVQAIKLACENSQGTNTTTGGSVDVKAGGQVPYTFQCIGCLLAGALNVGAVSGNNVISLAAGSTTRLIGTLVENCEAPSANCSSPNTILIKNFGGTLYTNNTSLQAIAIGGNPVAGLYCSNSGGVSYLDSTTLAAIGGGQGYVDVAGCILNDLGGNSGIFNGSPAVAGAFIADGHSTMFSCTGVANASATNSLYGTGPNVTATTCAGQTATLGTGIPFQQARTISAVLCTSSATTVSVACTVVINGSPASTTCTMTAATRCTNFTTTAVNPADLLSARIVTGAAETGANIKMQVIWQ